MLELHWPWVLLLLPVPYLVYRFVPAAQQRLAAIRVPDTSPLGRLAAGHQPGPGTSSLARFLVASLMWLALLLAVARPSWVGELEALPSTGRDLLLAVDISGSMRIEDMTLNDKPVRRLDLIKQVVNDFVQRREGDRLGLLLFGSQAYLQAPLTYDRKTVGALLKETEIGFAGSETAIGDAIGLAIKRLEKNAVEARVLILLTDGANTAGAVEPRKAAEIAARHHIKIYTIGVGAEEMIQRGLFFDQRVNPSADLDEGALKAIASTTGGRYFRARNENELKQIYQELDQLEPVEQAQEYSRPTRSLFHWPLTAALVLSMMLALHSLGPWSLFHRSTAKGRGQ